ncbi:MAG TPA: signal peptidase I, partial [Actinomycetota bacterium]
MGERPSGTADAAEAPASTPRRRFHEFPILVVFAIILAILIKTFLIQAFFIPSPSMVPTLRQGDRILVCRICMHLTDIDRGDILVFSDPTPEPG